MQQKSFSLRLFGGATIIADGRPATGAATQPRRLAVLAILAEAYPAAVTRERIVGLVWPEQDESGARRLLTQALYEIRRELGATIIAAAGRDLALNATTIDVDLVAFRRTLAEGNVTGALDLYRGAFLDGLHLREGGEFERWTSSVRQDIERELRRAIDATTRRLEAAGDIRHAAVLAERLLDLTPHDASNVLRAIDLFERIGDPGAATRVIETYARRMREDLELPPDPQITERATRIGRATPMIEVPRTPAAPVVETRNAPRRLVPAAPPAAISRRLIAFGAASLVIMILLLARQLRAPHVDPVPRLHVALFDTRGDTLAARIGASVTSVLRVNLDGAGGTRVDSSSHPAQTGRALTGLLVVTGNQVRIDATLSPSHPDQREMRVTVTGSADSSTALAERLSLELLPELYVNLEPESHRGIVRGLLDVPTARSYLDGESALRRAAFDSAYAHLRSATEHDSANAFLWYRRAVAAEEAHRIEEAERAAERADQQRATLAPREMALVRAYHVWRSGDTRLADSLYRALLAQRPSDPEAWFQFAEVSYHGGALLGRPLDASRDAWNRAVALDSSNFPALMHAIRLEARTGDTPRLHALLARAERVSAREPYLSEAKAIAAAAGDRRSLTTLDLRRLDTMPDASLQFVHAIIASFLERPDLAWSAAIRLIGTGRPDAVRAEGYAALAHLAMSRGETSLAESMIDTLSQHNATEAAWLRGYFTALPFSHPDSTRVAQALRALSMSTARSTAAPLYIELSVNAAAADVIQHYIASLLALRSGSNAARTLECVRLMPGPPRALCEDLERGLSAERFANLGKATEALAALDSLNLRVPYQLAGRSVFFARTRERFLRAQLLERAGRLAESYDWYASVPHTARLDYIYLAPSHLGRARIRERQGDIEGAAAHFRRAAELLTAADAGANDLKREADAGVARTRR